MTKGNLFDADAMARHGGPRRGPPPLNPSNPFVTLRRDFGCALVAAMRKSGVRRELELVSAAFPFPRHRPLRYFLKATLFRQTAPDMAEMETEVSQSDLDWTIVRPPRLTNGPARHAYRVADGRLPQGGFIIHGTDVAHFMIGEEENPAHLKKIVSVAN